MKNTTYHNSSLLFKILFWLTLVAFGFVLFHFVMMLLDFYPKPWVMEIYNTIQNGLPFFLFLTGSFIRNKKLKISMLLFFSTFMIGYLLNELDFYDLMDVNGIKWLLGPSLLGLVLIYFIHFFMKKQAVLLDYFKIIWFLCVSYAFLSARFPIGFHAIKFFEISIYLFPLLMSIGLFNFYRKME